ncbi:unnamed protein product [Penicillium manginii]
MEQRGEHQETTAGDTGASEQVRGTAVKPIQLVERASQRALSTTMTACGRGAGPFPSPRARIDELLVSISSVAGIDGKEGSTGGVEGFSYLGTVKIRRLKDANLKQKKKRKTENGSNGWIHVPLPCPPPAAAPAAGPVTASGPAPRLFTPVEDRSQNGFLPIGNHNKWSPSMKPESSCPITGAQGLVQDCLRWQISNIYMHQYLRLDPGPRLLTITPDILKWPSCSEAFPRASPCATPVPPLYIALALGGYTVQQPKVGHALHVMRSGLPPLRSVGGPTVRKQRRMRGRSVHL